MLSAPARLGAAVEAPLLHGDLSIVLTTLRPAKVRSLQEQLPGLTGGEGVLETGFGGYQPVRGRGLLRRLRTDAGLRPNGPS